MRRFLVLLALVGLLVTSCGGGGGSDGGNPYDVGSPPVIQSLQFYDIVMDCAEQYEEDVIAIYDNCTILRQANEQQPYALGVGDWFLLKITVEDPDLDVTYFNCENYLKEDGIYKLYSGPEVFVLPIQLASLVEYYLLFKGTNLPCGEWKNDTWFSDKEGNDSNMESLYGNVPCSPFTVETMLDHEYLGAIITPLGETIVQEGESLTVHFSNRYSDANVHWIDICRKANMMCVRRIVCPGADYTLENIRNNYVLVIHFDLPACVP